MRRTWWVVLAIVVVGGLGLRSSCSSGGKRAPDERLAQRFTELCKITSRHVESPRKGVQEVMRYLGDHSPAMAHDWFELLVLIERIDDDDAHDDRARLAGRRFERAGRACDHLEEFADAVENDPEATELLRANLERLDRSLSLIGGGGARLDALPALLRARVDAALRR